MRRAPFVKGLISFASDMTKGIANRFLPKSGFKGVALLVLSSILFLFFLAFASLGLWDILQEMSFPSWGASFMISGICLLGLIITFIAAKKAFRPKQQESINANELLTAFLDGLLGRD